MGKVFLNPNKPNRRCRWFGHDYEILSKEMHDYLFPPPETPNPRRRIYARGVQCRRCGAANGPDYK